MVGLFRRLKSILYFDSFVDSAAGALDAMHKKLVVHMNSPLLVYAVSNVNGKPCPIRYCSN